MVYKYNACYNFTCFIPIIKLSPRHAGAITVMCLIFLALFLLRFQQYICRLFLVGREGELF